MPTFTDEELKMLTDANILRGSTWGKAIEGASATTGHALTTDAGQSWVSNVTPATIDAYGFSVTNPATLPHWSDDFAPLPVIDPGMLESRSEREDLVASIWNGMVSALSIGRDAYCATHAAHYAGALDSDMEGIRQHLMEPQPEPEPPKVAPSNVKPAMAGLGVTAPEDHRLGRWKA